jgi:hypothetical protein
MKAEDHEIVSSDAISILYLETVSDSNKFQTTSFWEAQEKND